MAATFPVSLIYGNIKCLCQSNEIEVTRKVTITRTKQRQKKKKTGSLVVIWELYVVNTYGNF